MKQIIVSDETHRLAKSAAAKEGIPMFRWFDRMIHAVCGNSVRETNQETQENPEDRK